MLLISLLRILIVQRDLFYSMVVQFYRRLEFCQESKDSKPLRHVIQNYVDGKKLTGVWLDYVLAEVPAVKKQ